MTSIHMDTFQRPAPYWLRRAEKCKQAGDLRRAAVLRRSCRLPHAGAQSGRIRIHAVTLSRSGTDAPRTELPQGSDD